MHRKIFVLGTRLVSTTLALGMSSEKKTVVVLKTLVLECAWVPAC